MEKADIERHLTVLGIAHIAYGLMGLVGALFMFMSLAGIGVVSLGACGESLPLAILGTLAVIFGGFMVVTFLPGLVGGIGLLKRQSWSRVVLLIVAFINLPVVPIGTALGIYTIWLLWKPEYLEQSVAA